MPPVEEPLSRADLVLLRRLVLEHKAGERRQRFPAVLHLGAPGRPEAGRIVDDHAAPDADRLDHALRCDLLEAMLKRVARVDTDRLMTWPLMTWPLMTWLTRPGPLEVADLDLEWLRAVTTVNDETGRALPFLVVTRDGWRDPRSGVGRSWVRLRQR